MLLVQADHDRVTARAEKGRWIGVDFWIIRQEQFSEIHGREEAN